MLGIGDSLNDAPMLQAVDYPYLVQRPNGEWRHFEVPNLIRIPAIGPLGFTAMVKDLETRWFEQLTSPHSQSSALPGLS